METINDLKTQLYTVEQAAAMAHCHANTIRARIKDGTLQASKPARAWLVTAESLAAWLGIKKQQA